IHPAGSDQAQGAVLLEAGRRIGSREIAVAASCGYAQLQVSALPRIAVVSTGDELVPVAQTPESHQIRRSNDLMMEAACRRAGYPVQVRHHLPDDPARSRADLE